MSLVKFTRIIFSNWSIKGQSICLMIIMIVSLHCISLYWRRHWIQLNFWKKKMVQGRLQRSSLTKLIRFLNAKEFAIPLDWWLFLIRLSLFENYLWHMSNTTKHYEDHSICLIFHHLGFIDCVANLAILLCYFWKEILLKHGLVFEKKNGPGAHSACKQQEIDTVFECKVVCRIFCNLSSFKIR